MGSISTYLLITSLFLLPLHCFLLQMEINNRDRGKVWLPLLCALVLIAGMILGFNLRDTLRSKRDISTVIARNDRLDDIIDLVDEKYVDTVNNNLLYKDAVSGILKSLDPHTVYIPADEVEGVNEGLEGGFSGIGVEFSVLRDTIEVTAVIDKGPAATAGVQVGDQLIKVEDTLVAGIHITSERITHLLKGKPQSVVAVTVKNSGGALKTMSISRGLIPTSSIEASIMLDDHTGFIKISRFSATTAGEFKNALKKLQTSGARQLVLDLRDNPGGYLDAATSIADNFLDGDKLVVFTTGSHAPKTEYRAKEKGMFETGRLVILVDEGSASASEILAGAIQDWDRGVIIGRRTYGKGLVQEQYELPDGAALRLTVARYFTPSGRCIQRSFAQGKQAYYHDYEKRLEDGELTGNDSVSSSDTIPFYTANHRLVYGGGGIKPDVYVPYDTTRFSLTFRNLIFSPGLKTVITDYFLQNRSRLKYSSINEFTRSFDGQEQIAGTYLASLEPGPRKLLIKELARPVNKDFMHLQIKARLARFLFQDNGYYTFSVQDDDVVKKALTVIGSDLYSKIIGRK